MRAFLTSLCIAAALAGCGEMDSADPTTTRVSALTLTLMPAADTFINSSVPDNNNGTSPSIYTGTNGQDGLMRGLVRFALPAGLQGRATITRATLTMVTRGLGATDMTPPTAGNEILNAVGVDWTEGAGFGDGPRSNTIGQACGTTGATWNQPDCTGGTDWAGGTVASATSATAAVPAALEATVTWDSDGGNGGNIGMVTDVQSWIDTPTSNHGWRIMSDTEGTNAQAQRFYAREVAGKGPSLTISATCTDPDAGDTCGAGGSGGTGGTGGGGGGGSGGGNGSGGGCSCAIATRGATSPGAAAFGVGALGLLAVRRRRRAR